MTGKNDANLPVGPVPSGAVSPAAAPAGTAGTSTTLPTNRAAGRPAHPPFATRAATAPRPPVPAPPPAPAVPPREAARRRWPVGGTLTLGLVSLLILVGGFGGWATFSRISGAVVSPGQIEVERHRQIVQHPDGGVVDAILVREGQPVKAGDTLVRLDGELLRTELAIVEGQYFEILARRGRLEAERDTADAPRFPPELTDSLAERPALQELLDGQTSLFDARRDTLKQSLDQLEQQAQQVTEQIVGIEAQEAATRTQRDLIERELTDQRTLLEKGLAQAPRVLALEREAASLDGQLGELAASRAQGETRRTEIGITQLQQSSERRESAETDLRDQGYRELELAERRRGLTEQIARLDIRAPVSGIVHEMQVTTPRSVIRPADPIMFLVPQDRPLVVAARVSPLHVDEVRTGQDVMLRMSALSSRTTPEIGGTLANVSADAVTDQTTGVPYYRAEVTIAPDELARLGDAALVPGMPVEVFIQTGERSPMAYLLKPLTDYFSRALRET